MLYYISASGFWSALFFFVCLFCLEGFFYILFLFIGRNIKKKFFFNFGSAESLLWPLGSSLHAFSSVQLLRRV